MKAIYTLILVLLAGTSYGQTASNWIQDKTNGCKVYNENPISEESVQIIGNCVNEYLEGQGTVIWYLKGKFNQRAKGFYLKGKLNGYTEYTFADGNKYVGEYKDGKRNGQGTFTHSNGKKYVGEYKDGEPNGQGTYTHSNGDKYVGGFKDGKRNGQGTYTFANGDKYVGEFTDNKPNGQGIKYSANGSIESSGIYKDNVLVTSQYVDPKSFIHIARQNSAPAVSDSLRHEVDQAKVQLEHDRQLLAEERRSLEEDKRQRELVKQSSRISITAIATQPDASGVVTINIQTNTDTSSLKINGEE